MSNNVEQDTKETRSERCAFRATPSLKQAVLEAAEQESRSESSYIELVVRQDLERRGLIPPRRK